MISGYTELQSLTLTLHICTPRIFVARYLILPYLVIYLKQVLEAAGCEEILHLQEYFNNVVYPHGIQLYQIEEDEEDAIQHLSFLGDVLEVIKDWSPMKVRAQTNHFQFS